MKKPTALLLGLLVALPLAAQNDWTKRTHPIAGVTVVGQRPIKETGVQRTRFDSVALKENIALSMADVLTFNSPIFVKNYGRATLSTVAFRGTSPSHTQVTWNGMRISNPMLGMTDFSMIPSYFVDDASLLHGTSSVNETGGGLGGAVKLATKPISARGFGLQYVQGIGSFRTFDEFLRLTYGNDRWQFSTRAVCSSSANDYKYRNRDKKENIYDADKNIVGSYYPIERNRSGAFRDLHVLQEVYCNTGRGDRFGLNAWYIRSNRELPMLSTDYASDLRFENRQREETFRGIVSWDHLRRNWKAAAKAGYIHTWMAYDYRRDVGNGTMMPMTRSRSRIDTFYGQADGEYSIGGKWLFTASLSVYQHLVRSADKNIITQEGNKAIVGYDKGRIELWAVSRPNGGPSSGSAFRSSCARSCSARSGRPSSPLFSSTAYSPSGATSWPKPPSRATSASPPSTTSISCRAAIPACTGRAAGPTMRGFRLPWARRSTTS